MGSEQSAVRRVPRWHWIPKAWAKYPVVGKTVEVSGVRLPGGKR